MSTSTFMPQGDFEYFVVAKMNPVFGCIANMTFNGLTMDAMFGLGALHEQASRALNGDVAAQRRVTEAACQVANDLRAIAGHMSEEYGNAVSDFAGRLLQMQSVSAHLAVA